MTLVNENVLAGLRKGSKFRVGRSNVDSGSAIEKGVKLPWVSDRAASWVYFDCTIGTLLDSGIAVHNRLPQVDNKPIDTLASTVLGLDDPQLDVVAVGVQLKCRDQYTDIVQRMGHARYWFRIWGQALRFGYQIPIPGIKTIGGVPAIPYDKNPQWAFNRIAPGGNYGGIILWHAQWSLWYTTATPPVNNDFPAADPSARITGKEPLPDGVQAPFTEPDSNAQRSGPPTPTKVVTQPGRIPT